MKKITSAERTVLLSRLKETTENALKRHFNIWGLKNIPISTDDVHLTYDQKAKLENKYKTLIKSSVLRNVSKDQLWKAYSKKASPSSFGYRTNIDGIALSGTVSFPIPEKLNKQILADEAKIKVPIFNRIQALMSDYYELKTVIMAYDPKSLNKLKVFAKKWRKLN